MCVCVCNESNKCVNRCDGEVVQLGIPVIGPFFVNIWTMMMCSKSIGSSCDLQEE